MYWKISAVLDYTAYVCKTQQKLNISSKDMMSPPHFHANGKTLKYIHVALKIVCAN